MIFFLIAIYFFNCDKFLFITICGYYCVIAQAYIVSSPRPILCHRPGLYCVIAQAYIVSSPRPILCHRPGLYCVIAQAYIVSSPRPILCHRPRPILCHRPGLVLISSHEQSLLLICLFGNVCKTSSKCILIFCESKYTLIDQHVWEKIGNIYLSGTNKM